jgi:hypothetical protein
MIKLTFYLPFINLQKESVYPAVQPRDPRARVTLLWSLPENADLIETKFKVQRFNSFFTYYLFIIFCFYTKF